MGGIVLVVVVVPAVVTYLLLPQPTASNAGHRPAEEKPAVAAGHEPAGEAHRTGIAEVSLGEFKISNGMAVPGETIDIEFKLAAVTAAQQAQGLEAQVKSHTARIRQAVIGIVRRSRYDELSDPQLDTIRQLIHEDVNRLLGKVYVNDVTITDVTITEQ
jgi:flagellar basal body-associated protein FliL